ncbi:hypothetical protein H0H81_008947 [Sphagnurus paluster]|uniref:Cyclohexanone monooxygenase n=1 Tax=Sphagnurus paluster TaxID=117069 RepID=A0A9P7FVJ4_9AGAR|nr:hypothetical protein H0H81_008947 [Sphagnurus paluster]
MSFQEYDTDHKDLDVVIVGAGFSGAYQLHQLRKAGFSVKVFEAGSRLGGTWYWNCYPGARVDFEYLVYQLSTEEVWKDWTWSERFPGRDELVAYFDHVDKKLDLSRDISFDTWVTGATFDASAHRWVVSTKCGRTARPRFLILCTGFASKPLLPDYPGLASYQGTIHHTSKWPQDGVELEGKRIGIIGTGASGVQVIQETAPVAAHLTVFQRTPNFAIPMHQRKLTKTEQVELREELYPIIFRRCKQTTSGAHVDAFYRGLLEMTPEEQRLTLEDFWERRFLAVAAFPDVYYDVNANKLAYDFWRDKVRKRIVDPTLHEKLAPELAPHPVAAKRLSLEQRYYEVFNQRNVTLVDLNETPILEITPKGIRTKDGVEHLLDVIVLATGFDAVTGSISQIDIRGADDTPIGQKWSDKGLSTYLGLASAGYPNMFFPYGPHSPGPLTNGPACLVGLKSEFQCDWIVDCLKYMRAHNYTRIEATPDAEAAWGARVEAIAKQGAWYRAKSWYTGANVPGKRVSILTFMGGLTLYSQLCRESAEDGYKGFILSHLQLSTI